MMNMMKGSYKNNDDQYDLDEMKDEVSLKLLISPIWEGSWIEEMVYLSS